MANPKNYTVRKRGNSWQANLSRRVTGGDRIQITRTTKAEAQAEAERKLKELSEYGADYLNLTAGQLSACREAIRHLVEKGFAATTIADAVRYYTLHNDPKAKKRTVAEVLTEFLDSKNAAGLSEFTLTDYRQKLSRFSGDFGTRPIHAITPMEMEKWLDKIEAKGMTRKDYRRHLSILFRFAASRHYARENTAGAIQKVTVKRTNPTILTPQEVRKLLFAAKRHKVGKEPALGRKLPFRAKKHYRGQMLPYFAIGCFCGLRPWELRRTSWTDVNLETKEIYVSPEACKTSQDRYVTIPDNCISWLKTIPKESRTGKIHHTRHEFNAIRKKAGLYLSRKDIAAATKKGKPCRHWHSDIMRHSAASHLYAMTQNAASTGAQMGHGLQVFFKHYKHAVTKAEGEAYFAIEPTDKETNVLELPKAAGQ